MNWIKDYSKSLKSIHAEELTDVYLFRPLAFVIVKLFYSFPLTPNHYSLLSLLSGIGASFYFIQGDAHSLKLGSAFFLLSCVLDCCDGMVARLKKNGSEFGKVIDGVVDYLVNIFVFISLAYGLQAHTLLETPSLFALLLFPLAGVSKIIHSIIYDYYLTEYLNCESNKCFSAEDEIKKVEGFKRKQNMDRLNPIKILALNVYVFYIKAQGRMQPTGLSYDPESYCRLNFKNLRQWSFIGPSMHNLALIISLVLFEPFVYLFYSIVLANLWLIKMYLQQNKNSKILLEKINI